MTDTPFFDLTGTFDADTARKITDTWATRIAQGDPQPIREHYRSNPHAGFRGLVAHLMTDGGKA